MKKNLVLKNNKSIKELLKRNRWIWPISVLLSNRLFANDLSFLILAFFLHNIFSITKCSSGQANRAYFPHCASKTHEIVALRNLYKVHIYYYIQKYIYIYIFILVHFSILLAFFIYFNYRYIEGLTTDSGVMSNWDRQLKASKEGIRAPGKWLKLWIIIFNRFLTAFISFF